MLYPRTCGLAISVNNTLHLLIPNSQLIPDLQVCCLYVFIFGCCGSLLLCGLSLVVEGGSYSLVLDLGLLIVVASLLSELGL